MIGKFHPDNSGKMFTHFTPSLVITGNNGSVVYPYDPEFQSIDRSFGLEN